MKLQESPFERIKSGTKTVEFRLYDEKRSKINIGDQIEFSKLLLMQESILIWIVTIVLLILAFVCIKQEYFGELPWIAAMVGFPWSAYGVSQMYYYKKSMAENTKDGIKYDTVM